MSIENPEDVPEVWRTYFDDRGIEFSFRALHRKVEDSVSLNTVIRALTGEGTSIKRVVSALADELGVSPERFTAIREELAGTRPVEPFILPARANQLTEPERKAVVGVVNAILNARGDRDDLEATTESDAQTKGHKAKEAGNVLRPDHWNKAPLPPTVAQADAASEGFKHSDTEGASGTLSHYVALAREIFQDLADIDPSLDMREQAFSLERLIEPGSSLVAHSAYISSIGAMLDRARERLIEFAVKQPSAKKQAAAMIERLEAHANLAPVDG